jgi:hypothetical protein
LLPTWFYSASLVNLTFFLPSGKAFWQSFTAHEEIPEILVNSLFRHP